MEEEIKRYIADAVNAAVARFRAEGLLRDNGRTAFEKTETLLRQYPSLKKASGAYAERICKEIEDCLQSVGNEPYSEVIRLFYFEGMTNAACALELECEERTVRRNRKKLVEAFSVRLASEEFIKEILL